MPDRSSRPAVFLDRDGTLMRDTGYVSDPSLVEVLPGVSKALRALKERGYLTVIVTNQSGIGRGYFSVREYDAVHTRFLSLLGAPALIDATYRCDDHPEHPSERRKPAPGMLLEAAHEHGIDLGRSWMIGDREGDVTAGHRAGTRSILVLTGEARDATGSKADFVAQDFPAAVTFLLSQPGA